MIVIDKIIIILAFVLLYGLSFGPIGILYGLIIGILLAIFMHNHW
jgi:hypothetical protein